MRSAGRPWLSSIARLLEILSAGLSFLLLALKALLRLPGVLVGDRGTRKVKRKISVPPSPDRGVRPPIDSGGEVPPFRTEVEEMFDDDEGEDGEARIPAFPTDEAAVTSEASADTRRVNAWIADGEASPREPLRVGAPYVLNLNVGRPIEGSLTEGPSAEISAADIPKEGLLTDWTITSSTVRLEPGSMGVKVTEDADGKAWVARFSLTIPKARNSEVRRLRITPQTTNGTLHILIFALGDLYRELIVELKAAEHAERIVPSRKEAVAVSSDLLYSAAAHLKIPTPHEWQTAPGTFSVVLRPPFVIFKGDVAGKSVDDSEEWPAATAAVSRLILNVREAADDFRAAHQDYLDAISATDLAARLASFRQDHSQRVYDWSAIPDLSSDAHRQLWHSVSVSVELRRLATRGAALYGGFFPPGTRVRQWLDGLWPGQRIDFSWLNKSGNNWIPHIPWGLMYQGPVPSSGEPIDPERFLGLRFRIGYNAHSVAGGKALGSLEETYQGCCLYWGEPAGDATATEAQSQRAEFAAWQRQIFIPNTPGRGAKSELLQFLNTPRPEPVPVLYLFCQARAGTDRPSVLGFGNEVEDLVDTSDLEGGPFGDRPLVFMNACTSAAADPYVANDLEMLFFERNCRAYLGTECKVPISLAARFASTFFRFFYRTVAPEPMAAGEAVAQARLLFWAHFRNIGGLFYSYVNQFDLFMAGDDELRAMAHRG